MWLPGFTTVGTDANPGAANGVFVVISEHGSILVIKDDVGRHYVYADDDAGLGPIVTPSSKNMIASFLQRLLPT